MSEEFKPNWSIANQYFALMCMLLGQFPDFERGMETQHVEMSIIITGADGSDMQFIIDSNGQRTQKRLPFVANCNQLCEYHCDN